MNKRFNKEEIIKAYSDLEQEQSPKGALLGAILGAVPAAGLFYLFTLMGGTLLWLIFLPAALIGFQSAYLGKTFEFKYRLIPALIASLVHAIGLLIIFQTHSFFLITLPLSFGVAFYFSKRKFDNLQETAMWQKKHGKI
ncbi:MAG: hypothetical protein ACI93R_003315 [Flavobacteriales bacterium]|jgi:hypothetical protein